MPLPLGAGAAPPALQLPLPLGAWVPPLVLGAAPHVFCPPHDPWPVAWEPIAPVVLVAVSPLPWAQPEDRARAAVVIARRVDLRVSFIDISVGIRSVRWSYVEVAKALHLRRELRSASAVLANLEATALRVS